MSPPPLTPEKKVTPHLRSVSMSAKLPLDLSSAALSSGLTAVLIYSYSSFFLLGKQKAPAALQGLGAALFLSDWLGRERPPAKPNKGQDYEYEGARLCHRKLNATAPEPRPSCGSETNPRSRAGWRRSPPP